MAAIPLLTVREAIQRAFIEDLGDAGDITSDACIPEAATATAVIAPRKNGVLAGLSVAAEAFLTIDPKLDVQPLAADTDNAQARVAVLSVSGSARSILMGERVALNFLSHMSGIATATAALVAETAGSKARIACTRKTTPGLRAFEKYAVRCGGGSNHRFGLYDAVMIKDNHIAAAGDIAKAIDGARAKVGHTVSIEVEVDTIDQLVEALAAKPDIVLLDNMSTDDLRQAVDITNGAAILEASGNVTVETVAAIAATGVDVISSGWITHSAPVLDLGLDFK
ncbi:MAG: carboxylating nicotinate-nucleotide diphosphorylase [Pseudomonadota bacterium]